MQGLESSLEKTSKWIEETTEKTNSPSPTICPDSK